MATCAEFCNGLDFIANVERPANRFPVGGRSGWPSRVDDSTRLGSCDATG